MGSEWSGGASTEWSGGGGSAEWSGDGGSDWVAERGVSRDWDTFERGVVVNGAPIADAEVQRAELLAGPIDPGNYWYDIRAGFWGVVGGPCLGILPAHIPQLREPMRRDCAGGRTRVVVNGRELSQRDLGPLTQRGMPGAPHRVYTLDATGQLRDATSNALVSHLGHLAPSLESKRGNGMYPPSSD
ncbi:hypothetical protein CLOP_g20100 [Closterium sp. NIES-67]|nr:hypothetical protein CLOP_g20100 [Closterium sp. NIES-67]